MHLLLLTTLSLPLRGQISGISDKISNSKTMRYLKAGKTNN
jgi:hypothetical protein